MQQALEVFDKVERAVISIGEHLLTSLRYADDTTSFGTTTNAVWQMLESVETVS